MVKWQFSGGSDLDVDCCQEEATHASKIASRYQDDIFQHNLPSSSRPASARSGHSLVSPIPSPPPINPALLTTAPLPASAMLYAAAAAGESIYCFFNGIQKCVLIGGTVYKTQNVLLCKSSLRLSF